MVSMDVSFRLLAHNGRAAIPMTLIARRGQVPIFHRRFPAFCHTSANSISGKMLQRMPAQSTSVSSQGLAANRPPCMERPLGQGQELVGVKP